MRKANAEMKKPKNERITLAIVFVVFVLYAITLIYPFVMMIYNSFKLSGDFFADIWGLPKNPTLENYREIFNYRWQKTGVLGMFANSVFLTTVGVGISVLLSCMTSYIIAKYPFKGSKFVYSMVVVCMMIPTTGSLSATYNLLYKTKLLNKFVGNFLMQGGFGGVFLYLYAYFKSVSWTYAESAFIDGAGHARVFFQIMLPQVLGGVMAFFLISFISAWNDYFSQYLFLRSKPTIAVGLFQIISKYKNSNNWPMIFAGSTIVIIPALVFFAIFSRKIMENTSVGGIKG